MRKPSLRKCDMARSALWCGKIRMDTLIRIPDLQAEAEVPPIISKETAATPDLDPVASELSPVHRTIRLPPILNPEGIYRTSPTVILGGVVVVAGLLIIFFVNGGADRSNPSPDSAQLEAVPSGKDAPYAGTKTTPSPSLRASYAENVEKLSSAQLADSAPQIPTPDTTVSRWPRETLEEPIARFEGILTKPNMRARHEQHGSSLH